MLIDVHAHLDDEKIRDDAQNILLRAKENGVNIIINASSSFNASKRSLELATKYDNVYAAIGIHPEEIADYTPEFVEFVRKNAKNPKVVAIGEIGLDYHCQPCDKDAQKVVFIEQLKLANEVGLPVQIHMRDATKDTLDILKANKNLLKNGGIMHCFSGSLETLKEIQNLGLKISIGGISTFKNARETLVIAENAPNDMIMLETDCPYLAPEPVRGTLNEPKNVYHIAKKLSYIRPMSFEEIAKITTQNALRVFTKIKI